MAVQLAPEPVLPEVQAPDQTCPAEDQRRVTPKTPHPTQRIEVGEDGTWRIHGYEEIRQVLRSELVRQAGFNSEEYAGTQVQLMKNPPILFIDGQKHHELRRETNKFFTPAVTDKVYRTFMETFADDVVEKLRAQKRVDLSQLTMQMALQVTARVVGLTRSLIPGLNTRLNNLLGTTESTPRWLPAPLRLLVSQRHMLAFLLLDVQPSIRERRKQRREDVISYLIDRSYNDLEILTECVVYGVAGMVTTREFIAVALLHLLNNPPLKTRMQVGSQEERYAILHEILRIEPIVGHLYRRTTDDMPIESDGQTVTIPKGTRLDLVIYSANTDSSILGENAYAVCPMRPLHSHSGKVSEPVLSFGDGFHRCPGAYIAIQESDILLRKLLALDTLRIETEPDVTFNPTVGGNEVRNLFVSV